MAYRIAWQQQGVLIDFYGCVEGDDLVASYHQLQRDERCDNSRFFISNFLDMTQMNYSFIDIEKRAHLDRAYAHSNPRVKAALVATDEEALALASLYQSVLADTPWQCHFFTTLSAAQNWAGEKSSDTLKYKQSMC